MTELALRVDGIGKQYELGRQQAGYQTLREKLVEWATNPLAGLRRDKSSRPTFWALRGVSFEVKKGEVIGIIGRNGAGKCTLLKILSRITEPTTGGPTSTAASAACSRWAPASTRADRSRECLPEWGDSRDVAREKSEKFDEIVAFAEVEKFIDTAVKHYSSGMYVRLAFAVAAHLEPEILIVDEVLAVAISPFRRSALARWAKWRRAGGPCCS